MPWRVNREYCLANECNPFADPPFGLDSCGDLTCIRDFPCCCPRIRRVNSGHEICVWPYNGGIASLITTDGPEKNTLQWSPDGINFEIQSVIKGAPHAIGLNRSADNEKEPTEILRWGLTHEYKTSDYQYIRGFTTVNKTTHVAKGATAK